LWACSSWGCLLVILFSWYFGKLWVCDWACRIPELWSMCFFFSINHLYMYIYCNGWKYLCLVQSKHSKAIELAVQPVFGWTNEQWPLTNDLTDLVLVTMVMAMPVPLPRSLCLGSQLPRTRGCARREMSKKRDGFFNQVKIVTSEFQRKRYVPWRCYVKKNRVYSMLLFFRG
jgi:hypothetical protein